MNTIQSTVEIDNRLVNVVHIDWEKRNWKRFLIPEEERERTAKMLRLNGCPDYDLRLLADSSQKKKLTARIKRLRSGKLKGAFSITKEREKAEKALRLNGG